jgi:hypothetical protein
MVPVQNENQTLASGTLPELFRLVPKPSGMTGTSRYQRRLEFTRSTALEVVCIPPNMTHGPRGYRAISSDPTVPEKYARYQPMVMLSAVVPGRGPAGAGGHHLHRRIPGSSPNLLQAGRAFLIKS